MITRGDNGFMPHRVIVSAWCWCSGLLNSEAGKSLQRTVRIQQPRDRESAVNTCGWWESRINPAVSDSRVPSEHWHICRLSDSATKYTAYTSGTDNTHMISDMQSSSSINPLKYMLLATLVITERSSQWGQTERLQDLISVWRGYQRLKMVPPGLSSAADHDIISRLFVHSLIRTWHKHSF